MQDYNYVNSNCFEITLELSCCKYPNVSKLKEEWDNNKEALLTYMEMVFKNHFFMSLKTFFYSIIIFLLLGSFRG
jgi:hypothetical protein